MRRPRIWVLLAGGLALAALIWFLARRFPGALADEMAGVELVRLGALAALVGSGLLAMRARPGLLVRHVFVWLAIALVLALGYSYRHELGAIGDRLAAALVPGHAVEETVGALAFTARRDGHFYVEATVDGTPILFLVDTGASVVVLSPADARRLGFALDRLRYDQVYETANGRTQGAPVRLGALAIGQHRVRDVRATVIRSPLSHSLLGMSFLDRLAGYEVRDDRLFLRWK